MMDKRNDHAGHDAGKRKNIISKLAVCVLCCVLLVLGVMYVNGSMSDGLRIAGLGLRSSCIPLAGKDGW